MFFMNSAKNVMLAMVWFIMLAIPVLGEETVPAQPASEAAEIIVDETPAPAKEPEKAEEIPQIEVLAHKEKAATSSVVTKEEISTGPYMNLPGYLEEQTGIDLTRRSLLGVQSSQMRLRGFDESRYQVYINGRTWKGAGVKGGFYVDWSTITTTDLERLEVIRGGLSAEYPNTLGGVITSTPSGAVKNPISISTTTGAAGTPRTTGCFTAAARAQCSMCWDSATAAVTATCGTTLSGTASMSTPA
jgi:outer membrane cobalamin receptor